MDFGIARFRRILFTSCGGLASTNLVDLTDTMIAGHLLGEKALSSINLFWPCVELLFFVSLAIAAGSAILYSRAAGDFNARRASGIFSNGLVLSVLVGIGLGIGLCLLCKPALAFYGISDEMGGYLSGYWYAYGLVAVAFPVYMYLCTMVTSDGGSVIGAASFVAELVVNAIASYFLCQAFGAAGCAFGVLAGVLAAIAVASLHFLRKTNSFVFRWHFSVRESVEAFLADLPEASAALFTAFVYVAMNKMLIVWFGEDAILVMTAVIVTNGFALFLYGVPRAAQPIVGVYWAEGNFGSVRRVMRVALTTSLTLGVLTGLAFILAPGLVLRLIGVTTPEVVRQAVFAIRAVACTYPFVAVTALFTAYYLYVQRLALSLSLVALQGVVLPILFSAVVSIPWGQDGFWLGYAVATPSAILLFFAGMRLVCRDRLEAPPWFLDLTRDVYTTTWTLKTEPVDICRVAECVQKKLRDVEAPVRTLAKVALLLEDMLMAIRERNGGKAVLAEVQLDIRSAGASDGRFDARLLLRDDGVIADQTLEPSKPEDAAEQFRGEMLTKVMRNLRGRRSRVTTGFNRQEFVL